MQLGLGVAAGHVGDGLVAQLGHVVHQLVQEVVLELLGALVAGHAVADVAQVGVGRDGAHAVGQGQHVAHVGALVGGVDVELGDQLALDPAQQVVHHVGVVFIGEEALDLAGQGQLKLLVDELHQLVAPADDVEHLVGQGAGEVTLGDGAALGEVGQRQHVLFKVDGHAVLAHHLVDGGDHLAVTLVALLAVGREESVDLGGLVAGHAVQRHVDHALLVGVVELLVGKGGVCKAHAALDADGGAHVGGLGGGEELLRAGDGIVVHQAAGAQTGGAGEPHRGGGGVGGEGVGGVNVVVHIATGLRLGLGLHQFLEVLKSLGAVEQLQQLFAGFCHGENILSINACAAKDSAARHDYLPIFILSRRKFGFKAFAGR